jgi:hypothetical protein
MVWMKLHRFSSLYEEFIAAEHNKEEIVEVISH